ncbi:MAG: hypothetical protein IT440_02240 [Phycisphaeraceae bacterium]|nr:hypothetical protein [Phycisphaeraceae bacterium]
MIRFPCPNCGTAFSVPDNFAGRKGRCKKCGATIQAPTGESASAPRRDPRPSTSVPVDMIGRALTGAVTGQMRRANSPFTPAVPVPSHAARTASASVPAGDNGQAASLDAVPRKLPLRARRLLSDARLIRKMFRGSEFIRVRPRHGEPPEVYEVEYRVSSIQVGKGGKLVPCHRHLVEIQLTQDYPRMAPICRMLTPIFHPNISEASVCIGDHWVAGEHLADLIVRIGEMIAYQAYNIKSPLNAEAAMWVDLNMDKLPLDNRDLTPPVKAQ